MLSGTVVVAGIVVEVVVAEDVDVDVDVVLPEPPPPPPPPDDCCGPSSVMIGSVGTLDTDT